MIDDKLCMKPQTHKDDIDNNFFKFAKYKWIVYYNYN